jgi:hypothetical protein
MIFSQINLAKFHMTFGVKPPDSIKMEGFIMIYMGRLQIIWVQLRLHLNFRQMDRELALLLCELIL